ncbi:MAG TPA: alginate lyase family protein [Gaiellaceae bacterium]|nr:alginate lyase family protein [Gaiellaceae bacterium]
MARRRAPLFAGAIVLVLLAGALLLLALPGDEQEPPPPPSAGPRAGIWLSAAEIRRLPTEGPAWEALLREADRKPRRADVSDQDSLHDVRTLAAALVHARTGAEVYRERAAEGIDDAIGTERGGRTLALGRNLVGYVVAADLIDLRAYDADADERFREWLGEVRDERLDDGRTLRETHAERPNNWGAMAGASRAAIAVYLGDRDDLEQAAKVFRGYLGDRSAYAGFEYGDDLSWQADEDEPVGVNPAGATRDGIELGGALPDDMRRGCPLRAPPCHTGYAWEALQGLLVQAEILARQGYEVWDWSDRALLRAVEFVYGLDERYGGWAPEGDDGWQVWLANRAYGTDFETEQPTRPGKNMGFTDWTHQRLS